MVWTVDAQADTALLLLHGRGADARGMLDLAEAVLPCPARVAAPQAAGHSWYPQRFVAPFEANQPWLDSALALGAALLEDWLAAGIPPGRIAMGGFSQGACLALELAARNPRPWGAVLGLAGGLIGPSGTRFELRPTLAGTPIFLACSEADPHIPWARVEETAAAFAAVGAEPELRRIPGDMHGVREADLLAARALLARRFGIAGD